MDNEDRKARFLSKIEIMPETGCWEWQAGKYRDYKGNYSYGQFWWGENKSVKASRAAWMLLRGPIPEGGQILHKCNNPPCCNPDHLYVGDHDQNMRDRDESGRTSKWDKRYNFKRSDDLIIKLKECFKAGATAAQTMKILGIGWQTIYRAREQDAELKAIMAETKRARYSKAGKQRWADGHGKGSKGK